MANPRSPFHKPCFPVMIMVLLATFMVRGIAQESPDRTDLITTMTTPDFSTPFTIGISIGGVSNQHRGGFTTFSTVPVCCPTPYPNHNKGGLSGSLLAEIPITGRLAVSIKLGATTMDAKFRQQEHVLASIMGRPQTVSIEHWLDATIFAGQAEAGAKIRLFPAFFFEAGIAATLPIKPEFYYLEYLLTPGASFYTINPLTQKLEASDSRNHYAGELPQSTLFWRAYIGLESELVVLSRYPGDRVGRMSIGIYARYYHALTGISAEAPEWKIAGIGAGLTFKFRPSLF